VQAWTALINSKVTHLGDGRLKAPPWPVPEDDERCIGMSRYFLTRVVTAATASTDPRMTIAGRIAALGSHYLDDPTQAALKALAHLVG
jgi:hypothetical protein